LVGVNLPLALLSAEFTCADAAFTSTFRVLSKAMSAVQHTAVE